MCRRIRKQNRENNSNEVLIGHEIPLLVVAESKFTQLNKLQKREN
jgi:hypothetical protein